MRQDNDQMKHVDTNDGAQREAELAHPLERRVMLWLDDLRDPAQHGAIGWTWAKTAEEAIAILRTGHVVRASLDHDLTVSQTMGEPDGKPTGYDVLRWMVDNRIWPRDGVEVHSLNPAGKARMLRLIREHLAA